MKTIGVIFIVLLLSSCSPFALNIHGYVQKSESLSEAWAETASYIYEDEAFDYWKSPAEFIADGGGDCEDFAAYLVYLLGPDASLVVFKIPESGYIKFEDMAIWFDGQGNHAIVSYKGIYIEPQIYGLLYGKDDINIIKTIGYDELMGYVTMHGLKRL